MTTRSVKSSMVWIWLLSAREKMTPPNELDSATPILLRRVTIAAAGNSHSNANRQSDETSNAKIRQITWIFRFYTCKIRWRAEKEVYSLLINHLERCFYIQKNDRKVSRRVKSFSNWISQEHFKCWGPSLLHGFMRDIAGRDHSNNQICSIQERTIDLNERYYKENKRAIHKAIDGMHGLWVCPKSLTEIRWRILDWHRRAGVDYINSKSIL